MMQTGCNGLELVPETVFHEHRFVPLIESEVVQNPGWPKEQVDDDDDDDDDDDETFNLKD
jgi:hypothetical protein